MDTTYNTFTTHNGTQFLEIEQLKTYACESRSEPGIYRTQTVTELPDETYKITCDCNADFWGNRKCYHLKELYTIFGNIIRYHLEPDITFV